MGGVSDFLDMASSRMMLGRSSSHGGVSVVEGHVVQFDPQVLKMGPDPEAEGANGRGI